VEKCSSGPACESQYYDVLSCAVKECTCTRSENTKEQETLPVEEGIAKDECQAVAQALGACFDETEEANKDVCWEDCVLPAFGSSDSCDTFCSAVEQCRGEKCSSGPACESQYYDVVNCAVTECTCAGSGNTEEQEALAVGQGIENDECLPASVVLGACFADNEEANEEVCWEDCVLPAYESLDSCDSFCSAVEQCRVEKCSSGPACESQYYDVLSCAVKECTCTRSENTKEQETLPVEEGIAKDECQAVAQALGACFDETEEANKDVCWEDCVLPAFGSSDSCDTFCSAVEQCRGEKCSSGPACESQYYDVVNCAVTECTCTGSESMEEKESLAVGDGDQNDHAPVEETCSSDTCIEL